ncbi:unnamed protein product [Ixodes persulcatus]
MRIHLPWLPAHSCPLSLSLFSVVPLQLPPAPTEPPSPSIPAPPPLFPYSVWPAAPLCPPPHSASPPESSSLAALFPGPLSSPSPLVLFGSHHSVGSPNFFAVPLAPPWPLPQSASAPPTESLAATPLPRAFLCPPSSPLPSPPVYRSTSVLVPLASPSPLPAASPCPSASSPIPYSAFLSCAPLPSKPPPSPPALPSLQRTLLPPPPASPVSRVPPRAPSSSPRASRTPRPLFRTSCTGTLCLSPPRCWRKASLQGSTSVHTRRIRRPAFPSLPSNVASRQTLEKRLTHDPRLGVNHVLRSVSPLSTATLKHIIN